METLTFDSLLGQEFGRLPEFLTALAVGLLIGLERERNQTAKAGLRTFTLVALVGALSAVLAEKFTAPSIIGVGLGAISIAIIAAYYHHHEKFHEKDPGTTTIVAVIVCYLLAVMVMTGFVRLAVILAILVTALLYFKAELSGVAHGLERRDLISILQFAVVTFVVLPLLPDQGFGPYAVLNPRHIWLMVVLISGVSLFGYVALRVLGQAHSALLLGLSGGLVSSTATTLSFSRYARENKGITDLSVTVIIAANLVLLLRLAVLAAVVSPVVLSVVAPILGIALIAGLVVFAFTKRHKTDATEISAPKITNPSELSTALGFAALYAAVLLLSAWLVDIADSKGIYAVALVSGLTDVDAITLSGLRLYGLGTVSIGQVATIIVLSIAANVTFKLGIALAVGGIGLFRRCLPAMVAVVVGAGTGLAIFT